MERSKSSSRPIGRIALVAGIIFLLLGSVSVLAVEYIIEEDFSDSELPEWTLLGSDWTDAWNSNGIDPTIEISHTYEINNELISSGEFNMYKYNIVYRENPTSFGAWSFEVNYAENEFQAQIGIFAFYLTENPIAVGNMIGHDGFNLTGDENIHMAISDSAIRYGVISTASSLIPLDVRGFDTWKHFDVVRTESQIFVYIKGQIAMNRSISAESYTNLKYITLVTAQGSETKFDDLKISTDYSGTLDQIKANETSVSTNDGFLILAYILPGLTLTTIAVFYVKKIIQKKRLKKLIEISSNGRYPSVSRGINEMFGDNKSLYFTLLGHKTLKQKPIQDKLEASIPEEMSQYRNIIHPFRLSIMRILYKNVRTPSTELKEMLNLTWSDFHSHINSMKKRAYVGVVEDFDDFGLRRQVVFLEERGKSDFEKLIKLLKQFLDKATEFIPESGKDPDLYPLS